MIEDVKKMADSGFCVIPVKNKRPCVRWKDFQTELPQGEEIEIWFTNTGWQPALVCGAISGGLECLDFDNPGKVAKSNFDLWSELVKAQKPDLMEKIYVETTPSGGYHVLYRCINPGNNKILSYNVVDDKKRAVVELKAEGGLVNCAPGAGYERVSGHLLVLEKISGEEREILISSARALNTVAEEVDYDE